MTGFAFGRPQVLASQATQTPSGGDPWASALGSAGFFGAVAGSLMSAIGSYYSLKSQKQQLRSQALSAEFEQSMANINARAAESEASAILEAGRQQSGQSSAAYGQALASQRAARGAAGIAGGVGSAAEIDATTELARQQDAFTIDLNTIRQANAAKAGATNERNRALAAGVSARNIRGTAGTIRPGLAATASLLGGANLLSDSWRTYRRTR